MKFETTTIGKICTVGDGAHASIARAEIGVPYLTSKNFSKDGINLQQVEYISEQDYKKHFRNESKALTKPSESDLIFSIIGSIGGAYLYNLNDRFGLSSSVAIIRPNHAKVFPLFLLYYLKSPYLQKWVDAIKSGSAQGFLSLEMIRALPVIVPSLPIQVKISSILSDYDELIENNNQRIKLLEQMAEGIYKEWFVRLRFPGYETVQFLNIEGEVVEHNAVGALPHDWAKVKIKDAFGIQGGGTPPTEKLEFWDDGIINWFSPTDITGSKSIFLNNSTKQITSLGLNNSSAKIFPAKSVMMTSRATIGAAGINLTEACTNQGFITCLPNKSFTYPYIYEWIKVNKNLLENYSTGATFKEISRGVFKNLDIIKPSTNTINKYTELVEPMFDEIQILSAKNQLLHQTRDLLLPRLISGKLSVEHLVEEVVHLPMAAEPEVKYKE
jgi:type I restriction enzyme, S subunit